VSRNIRGRDKLILSLLLYTLIILFKNNILWIVTKQIGRRSYHLANPAETDLYVIVARIVLRTLHQHRTTGAGCYYGLWVDRVSHSLCRLLRNIRVVPLEEEWK